MTDTDDPILQAQTLIADADRRLAHDADLLLTYLAAFSASIVDLAGVDRRTEILAGLTALQRRYAGLLLPRRSVADVVLGQLVLDLWAFIVDPETRLTRDDLAHRVKAVLGEKVEGT